MNSSGMHESTGRDPWRSPRPPRHQGVAGRVLLVVLLAGLFILPFSGAGRRLKEGTIEVIRAAQGAPMGGAVASKEAAPAPPPQVIVQEKIVYRDPPPPPLPNAYVPRKSVAVSELFNGIKIQTKLQSTVGGRAAAERSRDEAYQIQFSVDVTVPSPSTTLPELESLNAHLSKALPGLVEMVPTARVSGFYHKLYELKQQMVEKNLTQLDKPLSRHNFFDCETILELRHPVSDRRVLLMQGEMDVVADGSDGDRMGSFDDYVFASSNFQGTTSYSWKKRTKQANPLIPKYEERLKEAEKKLAAATGSAVKKSLAGDIDFYRKTLVSLKTTSFLIASEDPFIVLPLSLRGYGEVQEFAPQLGDYAVVMSGNKLLPAIIGDYGPREKMGEASLRIAKEINEKATPYVRPESDLKISYLIFTGSADKPFGPPDYARWHQRCSELLAEMGGVGEGYGLHQWEDRLQAPVTPAGEVPVPAGTAGDVPAVPAVPATAQPASVGAAGEVPVPVTAEPAGEVPATAAPAGEVPATAAPASEVPAVAEPEPAAVETAVLPPAAAPVLEVR